MPPKRIAKRTQTSVSSATRQVKVTLFSVVGLWLGLMFAGLVFISDAVMTAALIFTQVALALYALWRILLIAVSRHTSPAPDIQIPLPKYTVLVALYDEAEILPHLVRNLSAIDYPANRLEGFLLLEARDQKTIFAAQNIALPEWLKVVVVPAGSPQTKPRALNHGLGLASGQLLTIYDAEDCPDPQQLREAAARFAAAPDSLACLQAPLRIRRHNAPPVQSRIIDRQFAAEYAGLFEIVLPAMVRLGLPFPLGGTSNHFRTATLRTVGGWDAYNVTEDADLGFRLWRKGYRLGLLQHPTWETPPGRLQTWLPQRTRWLKGYMQTCAAHAFRAGLGWRGTISLLTTLGASLIAASIHGFAVATLASIVLLSLFAYSLPNLQLATWVVMFSGFSAAWTTNWLGAKRIGIPYTFADLAIAPFYWTLLTLAFIHAAVRLIIEPYAWDKTPHQPDIPAKDLQSASMIPRYLSAKAGREAA